MKLIITITNNEFVPNMLKIEAVILKMLEIQTSSQSFVEKKNSFSECSGCPVFVDDLLVEQKH